MTNKLFPRSRAAFTLVELLVVVSVIAMLIALLLPALSSAREQAKRTACAAKLKQFSLTMRQYCEEHRGYFIPTYSTANIGGASYWPQCIQANYYNLLKTEYALQDAMYDCPSTPGLAYRDYWDAYAFSYSYVPSLNPTIGQGVSFWRDPNQPIKADDATSETYIMGDGTQGFSSDLYFNHGVASGVTAGQENFAGANQAFGDGHVAWKPRNAFPDYMTAGSAPTWGNANMIHANGFPFSQFW